MGMNYVQSRSVEDLCSKMALSSVFGSITSVSKEYWKCMWLQKDLHNVLWSPLSSVSLTYGQS